MTARPRRGWLLRYSLPLSILVATMLLVPAMRTGFMLDDYSLWQTYESSDEVSLERGSLFGLFGFLYEDPEHVRARVRSGSLPWWTSEDLHIAFWRPLAEVTHWVDFALWPRSPLLMHVHSIGWYVLLLIALARLYREVDADPARNGVALLSYAVCGVHGIAIFWIANRNAMVSGVLAVGALVSFARWYRTRRSSHLVWSWLAYGGGLLAAEAGILVSAYLFAFVVSMARDASVRDRVRWLVPFAIIAIVWKTTSLALGYGSSHSGLYIDPVADPWSFFATTASRIPRLVAGSWFGVPAMISAEGSVSTFAFVVAQAALVLWLGRVVGAWRHEAVRFYTLGSLCALLPAAAVEPNDRLYLLPDIGAKAVLAWILVEAVRGLRMRNALRPFLVRTAVTSLALVHFVAVPAWMIFSARLWDAVDDTLVEGPALSLPRARSEEGGVSVLLNAPEPYLVIFMNPARELHGLADRSLLTIGPGTREITLQVQDDETVDVSVAEGFITGSDRVFRAENLPFTEGDEVDLGSAVARVQDVMEDGRPRRVSFRFSKPLSAPEWTFYRWTDQGYRSLTLPPPGEQLVLPAVDVSAAVEARIFGAHGSAEIERFSPRKSP